MSNPIHDLTPEGEHIFVAWLTVLGSLLTCAVYSRFYLSVFSQVIGLLSGAEDLLEAAGGSAAQQEANANIVIERVTNTVDSWQLRQMAVVRI